MPKDQKKPFIQRLYDAETSDEKFSVLELEVIQSGFDGVLYTFIPKLSRLTKSLLPVFQFSESYSDIINYYQKHDHSRNDFIIKMVEEGTTDIIDWWKEAEKLSLSKEEEIVSETPKKLFGVTKGITFPTLSGDSGGAGVSIISFKKEYFNKKINPEKLKKIQSFCKTYHDHVMTHQDARYKFILPILNSLTPKKTLVLKYLISGKPMKNITEEADITTRYAEKLLVDLRKDFGDISTNELIYFLGLLNITEYL